MKLYAVSETSYGRPIKLVLENGSHVSRQCPFPAAIQRTTPGRADPRRFKLLKHRLRCIEKRYLRLSKRLMRPSSIWKTWPAFYHAGQEQLIKRLRKK